MKQGEVVIISGFSGVGKGTVVKYLMDNYKGYELSISATTRDPRDYEIPGVHYHFKTDDEFIKMIEGDHFLEHAGYVGNFYGTPKAFVLENRSKGKHVILEIETAGALQVKEKIPDAKMIFILPPDGETLKQRLVGRGSESQEKIEKRLNKAAEETQFVDKYDYYVINDFVEKCALNINKIAHGETPDVITPEKIEKIKKEVLAFAKGE